MTSSKCCSLEGGVAENEKDDEDTTSSSGEICQEACSYHAVGCEQVDLDQERDMRMQNAAAVERLVDEEGGGRT